MPEVDGSLVDVVRQAATAVAEQRGAGVDRTALVRLAGRDVPVTVLSGEPVVAIVHPRRPGHDDVFAMLTPREREVAALVADGMTNARIAATLFLTLGTVKDHVHRILRKTGLPTRSAVASAWHS